MKIGKVKVRTQLTKLLMERVTLMLVQRGSELVSIGAQALIEDLIQSAQ